MITDLSAGFHSGGQSLNLKDVTISPKAKIPLKDCMDNENKSAWTYFQDKKINQVR
jgi:hypothetical protein